MKKNFYEAIQSIQFWIVALSAAGLLYVNYKILLAVGILTATIEQSVAAITNR